MRARDRRGVGRGRGRVLIVTRHLNWRDDEGGHIREIVAGLVERAPDHGLEVRATDLRHLYSAEVRDEELEFTRLGPAWRALAQRWDLAWVHWVFPALPHLVAGLLLRLRGAQVWCSPMSSLTTDFAEASWFRTSGPFWSWLRPKLVGALRVSWKWVATGFVLLGAEEIRQTGVSGSRAIVAPWPAPATSLGRAALQSSGAAESGRLGPVALVSRADPYRKGFDQLAEWVEAYGEHLPKPGAVLFLSGGDIPNRLVRLAEAGAIRIDTSSRGAELYRHLHECRAAILLSAWEGHARALLEAALIGLPTISSEGCNFQEIVEILGKGSVVARNDIPAIQAAFEAAANAPRDNYLARRLLDRRSVGEFFAEVLAAISRGESPAEPSYYRWFVQRQPPAGALGPDGGVIGAADQSEVA